jgi:hypothetical protein
MALCIFVNTTEIAKTMTSKDGAVVLKNVAGINITHKVARTITYDCDIYKVNAITFYPAIVDQTGRTYASVGPVRVDKRSLTRAKLNATNSNDGADCLFLFATLNNTCVVLTAQQTSELILSDFNTSQTLFREFFEQVYPGCLSFKPAQKSSFLAFLYKLFVTCVPLSYVQPNNTQSEVGSNTITILNVHFQRFQTCVKTRCGRYTIRPSIIPSSADTRALKVPTPPALIDIRTPDSSRSRMATTQNALEMWRRNHVSISEPSLLIVVTSITTPKTQNEVTICDIFSECTKRFAEVSRNCMATKNAKVYTSLNASIQVLKRWFSNTNASISHNRELVKAMRSAVAPFVMLCADKITAALNSTSIGATKYLSVQTLFGYALEYIYAMVFVLSKMIKTAKGSVMAETAMRDLQFTVALLMLRLCDLGAMTCQSLTFLSGGNSIGNVFFPTYSYDASFVAISQKYITAKSNTDSVKAVSEAATGILPILQDIKRLAPKTQSAVTAASVEEQITSGTALPLTPPDDAFSRAAQLQDSGEITGSYSSRLSTVP